MMTPTARSNTLPRIMNVLNSAINDFIHTLLFLQNHYIKNNETLSILFHISQSAVV